MSPFLMAYKHGISIVLVPFQEVATRRESLRSQRSRSAEMVDMRALMRGNEPAPRVHPHSG